MNDDFNTAKVLANLFELAPVINGIKGGQVKADAVSASSYQLLRTTFKTYLEDVLGLQPLQQNNDSKLDTVLQLVIEMRKEAKARKDYAASDKIRDMLAASGILLKDEKGGEMSYTIE
jgi:cysteinyl-tRNA synthetase